MLQFCVPKESCLMVRSSFTKFTPWKHIRGSNNLFLGYAPPKQFVTFVLRLLEAVIGIKQISLAIFIPVIIIYMYYPKAKCESNSQTIIEKQKKERKTPYLYIYVYLRWTKGRKVY